MTSSLSQPSQDEAEGDHACLYLARGDEVAPERPVFTGDVFVDVPYLTPDGAERTRSVLVLQHPCSLREDGLHLNNNVLVAEVRKHPPIDDWQRYTKLMPLPDLYPTLETGKRHQAAMFDKLAVVRSSELDVPNRRVACLSQEGVDLLLQRWIFASSRAVVELNRIDEVVAGPFSEAEIIEDWCTEAGEHGVPIDIAAADCIGWLREEQEPRTRQARLDEPAQRSAIRREARSLVSRRSDADWRLLIEHE